MATSPFNDDERKAREAEEARLAALKRQEELERQIQEKERAEEDRRLAESIARENDRRRSEEEWYEDIRRRKEEAARREEEVSEESSYHEDRLNGAGFIADAIIALSDKYEAQNQGGTNSTSTTPNPGPGPTPNPGPGPTPNNGPATIPGPTPSHGPTPNPSGSGFGNGGETPDVHTFQYDDDHFRSANRLRDAIQDRHEQNDEYKKAKEKVGKMAGSAARATSHRIDRTVNSALAQDDVGRETLEMKETMKVASNLLAGTALLLASTAASIVYEKKVRDAQEFANNAFKEEQTQRIAAVDNRNKRHLDMATKDLAFAEKQNKIADSANVAFAYKKRNWDAETAAANGALKNANDAVAFHKEWDKQSNDKSLREFSKQNTSKDLQVYEGANELARKVAIGRQDLVASAKTGAAETHARSTLFRLEMKGGGLAARSFSKSIYEKHLNIGKDLAHIFGTEKEVELLKKVDADAEAGKIAKANGQIFNSTVTDEDRKNAAKIVQKYAGSINTKKDIKETVAMYQIAIDELTTKANSISENIARTKAEIGEIEKQMAETQRLLKQNMSDLEALKTHRTAEGSKLNAKQRKQIEARLAKQPDPSELNAQFSLLKTKKNALVNKLNKDMDKLDKTNESRRGLVSHKELLSKHGDAVVNARKGGSKASKKTGKMSERSFKQSFGTISRKLNKTLNDGNEVHQEIRSAKKFLKKTEKSLKITKKSLGYVLKQTGGVIKIIGKHTGITGRLIDKIGKDRLEKFKKVAGKTGKFAGVILKTPKYIAHAPKYIAKGAFWAVRKGTIKVGGMAAHWGGKAAKSGARVAGKAAKSGANAVGKAARSGVTRLRNGKIYAYGRNRINMLSKKLSPWMSRINARFSPARARLNKLAQSASKPVRFVARAAQAAAKYVKKGFRAAKRGVSYIISLIIGIISSIISAFLTVIGVVVGAAGVLILFVLLIAVLMSALTAVIAAILNWIMEHNAQEDSYLKNHPELMISAAVNYRDAELEIFDLFAHASTDKKIIQVNNSPIYYALYSKGNFFGIPKKAKLERENDKGAKSLYNNDYYSYINDGWYRTGAEVIHGYDGDDAFWIDDCFDSDVKYYDNIKISYYKASDLEKDANGNYKIDPSKASKYEISNAKDALVLVDALYTQNNDTMQLTEMYAYLGVGEFQAMQSNEANNICNNLFWASHEIIYNSGTKDSQIKFHGYDSYGRLDAECNHYTTIRQYFTKTIPSEVEGEEPTVLSSSSSVRVCRGHIDLDVAIIVSSIKGGENDESGEGGMFEAAMNVPGLALPTTINAIISYNPDTGNFTWGSMTNLPFDPAKDWAKDSELRKLALVKLDSNYEYMVNEDSELSKNNKTIVHNYTTENSTQTKFSAFKKSNAGAFLFGMVFDGTKYYVESFISGEQKDIICHDGDDKYTISFVIREDGSPGIDD